VEGPDQNQEKHLVPYAPDFTPAALGKQLGEDRVLAWLVETAAETEAKSDLLQRIGEQCLAHIAGPKNRSDMASHVLQGLQNYLLVRVDEDGTVHLTDHGEQIRSADDRERDLLFARHILTRCNGYRLIEAIQRYELRGERPTLERLTEELDRHPTSKNISTMRAWLSRVGVISGTGYSVSQGKVTEVLGEGVAKILGLEPPELEFLLAARILAQSKSPTLDAPDVKRLAETRNPLVRIPSKALGTFVRGLIQKKLFEEADRSRGKGGTRVACRLSPLGIKLSDEQIRALLEQSAAGMLLGDMLPLAEIVSGLDQGDTDRIGRLGEMLAVHLCLMLGLKVIGWRTRLPVEVDVTAERTVALGYQRFHVQVKNVAGDLDSDRVDREVGAAAGTGATHLLFVVPRAGVTSPGLAEILTRSQLTPLHIFVLTRDSLGEPVSTVNMLASLRAQELRIAALKRAEAQRRETPV
jgi:hypothetical protein